MSAIAEQVLGLVLLPLLAIHAVLAAALWLWSGHVRDRALAALERCCPLGDDAPTPAKAAPGSEAARARRSARSPARPGATGQRRKLLLLTAHPDDECMFFAPTLSLLASQPGWHVHILCLSNGASLPLVVLLQLG